MSVDRPGTVRLVEFLVGGDRYALPMRVVERVVALEEGDGDALAGEAPRMVLAADVLGLPTGQAPQWGLVVRRGEDVLVLGVERVEGVREVREKALLEPPSRALSAAGLVAGLVRIGDELLVLLDEGAL